MAKRAGRLSRPEVIELARQVQTWQRHPDPCPELIRRRGIRARNRLVTGNLLMVPAVANKYLGRIADSGTLDYGDLLQAGALGLNRAAELFDPEKGYEFSTYAYNWIRQAIGHEVESRRETIKIPAAVGYTLMDGKPRKNASPEQIAAARIVERVRSLDFAHPAADYEGGQQLADTIASEGPTPLEQLMQVERTARIETAVADEIALLRLRIEDGATVHDLAPLLGINALQVKHALTAAAHRVREVVGAA